MGMSNRAKTPHILEGALLMQEKISGTDRCSSCIHGRPWLPSHLAMLTNEIGLQLYMRPVFASPLAGPDGICWLMPDYVDGL